MQINDSCTCTDLYRAYRKSRCLTIYLDFLVSGAWICQLDAWICQLGAWPCLLGVWNCLSRHAEPCHGNVPLARPGTGAAAWLDRGHLLSLLAARQLCVSAQIPLQIL